MFWVVRYTTRSLLLRRKHGALSLSLPLSLSVHVCVYIYMCVYIYIYIQATYIYLMPHKHYQSKLSVLQSVETQELCRVRCDLVSI